MVNAHFSNSFGPNFLVHLISCAVPAFLPNFDRPRCYQPLNFVSKTTICLRITYGTTNFCNHCNFSQPKIYGIYIFMTLNCFQNLRVVLKLVSSIQIKILNEMLACMDFLIRRYIKTSMTLIVKILFLQKQRIYFAANNLHLLKYNQLDVLEEILLRCLSFLRWIAKYLHQ